MEGLVEVRGLTKVYREGDVEHVVLRDIDAVIRPGEFAVLLGRSGSGKSTLLNLLGGIDVPTAGEVIVDGTSLTALSERERTLFRRRHIGFVFQFFNLISTLTVEENLRLPLELNAGTRQDGARRPRDLLELVGLADRAGSFPDRLSGGEQQRVAIVRALVHDPLLILASAGVVADFGWTRCWSGAGIIRTSKNSTTCRQEVLLSGWPQKYLPNCVPPTCSKHETMRKG